MGPKKKKKPIRAIQQPTHISSSQPSPSSLPPNHPDSLSPSSNRISNSPTIDHLSPSPSPLPNQPSPFPTSPISLAANHGCAAQNTIPRNPESLTTSVEAQVDTAPENLTEARISRIIALAEYSKKDEVTQLLTQIIDDFVSSDGSTGSDVADLDGHIAANIVENGNDELAVNAKRDRLDGHQAASVVENVVPGSDVVKKVSFADKVKVTEMDEGGNADHEHNMGMDNNDSALGNIMGGAERKVHGSTMDKNDVNFPALPSKIKAPNSSGLPPLATVLNPMPAPLYKSFLEMDPKEQDYQDNFEISLYQGKPAVLISDDEEMEMAKPFKYALVGKFVQSRPEMECVRRLFVNLRLKAAVEVTHLDFRHVLIVLHCEEDYSRIWSRKHYFVDRRQMRLFKWTPKFRPSEESSIVPVWVGFPDLPIHLSKNKRYLRSLASVIGYPLRMDSSTAAGTKPSLARALVEVDVRKELIQNIRCGNKNDSFWQKVIYEKLPTYCEICKHLGHSDKECYVNDPSKKPAGYATKLNGNTLDKETAVNKQISEGLIMQDTCKENDRNNVVSVTKVHEENTSALKWSAVDEEYDGQVEIEFITGDTIVIPHIGMVKNLDQSKVAAVRQFQDISQTGTVTTTKQNVVEPIIGTDAMEVNTEDDITLAAWKRNIRSTSKNTNLGPPKSRLQPDNQAPARKMGSSSRKKFSVKTDKTLRSRVSRSQSVNLFDNLNCHSDGDDYNKYDADSDG